MTRSIALIHRYERNDFVAAFNEAHGPNLASINEALDRADLFEKAAREVVAMCRSYGVLPHLIQDHAYDMVTRLVEAETSEFDLIGAAVAVEVEKVL